MEPAGCCTACPASPWVQNQLHKQLVRQATTLHFSIQVQRRNHGCRSGEPKSLLAAQCLGVKFYSQLSSLHHIDSDILTPPCCFSTEWASSSSSWCWVLSACRCFSLPLMLTLAPSAMLSSSSAQTPYFHKPIAALISCNAELGQMPAYTLLEHSLVRSIQRHNTNRKVSSGN